MPRRTKPAAAPVAAPAPETRKTPAEINAIIDAFGLEAILDLIERGSPMQKIADAIGVSKRSLNRWIDASSDRRADVDAARTEAGEWFAHQSLQVLDDIKPDATQGDIARARELSHRYAWMAKMMNRGTYGDKQELAVTTPASALTDEALDAEIAARLQRLQPGARLQ